jgi:hypothetical protein
MADNNNRKVVRLDELTGKVSKRGRKSTVDPVLVAELTSASTGEAVEVPEYRLSGPEFARYRSERIGRYATHEDPEASVLNAWNSRHRQRITALAKTVDFEVQPIFTNDGELFVGRIS